MSGLLPRSAHACRTCPSTSTACAAASPARWTPPPFTAGTAAAAAAARRLRCPHPRGTPGTRSTVPRRRSRLAATAGGGSGEGDSIDIDALAARLSREAEKLRQSGASWSSEDDAGDSDAAAYEAQPDAGRQEALRREAGAGPRPDLLRPFGYASQSAEAEALAAVGSGGFSPEEFELLSELGTINIQQSVTSVDLDDFPIPTSERSARTAVIAYTASFFSGMPFQDPVVVLVKEYLPGSKAVAINELQVLTHLAGMPEQSMKWQTAAAPLASNPPIVRLLGYFTAGQTEKAATLLQGEPPEDALWVVLKWDGLAPLALYPSAQQTSGIGLGRLFGAQDTSLLDRAKMLRSITRGSLQALAYCHEQGVVHGALGSGSVMLSTFDDRSAARLVVKLDNFGFARRVTLPKSPGGRGSSSQGSGEPPAAASQPAPLATDDTPLALGQREDLRALAVVLLECILSALAFSGPSQLTSAESIQRLLGEVFSWGVDEFRQYCEDEPDWAAAVELLSQDEGAGWALLQDLATGGRSAAELAASRFCEL